MQRRILLTLFAATALFGQQAAQKADEPKSKTLTRAEFDTLAANPGSVLVIDVRRPDEQTAKGSFPVYLSIQAASLEKSLAFIPKDRTIVAVSNHAARGLKAANLLASHGFKVAGAIGVENYEEQGGTLLKLAPPPPAATAKK